MLYVNMGKTLHGLKAEVATMREKRSSMPAMRLIEAKNVESGKDFRGTAPKAHGRCQESEQLNWGQRVRQRVQRVHHRG